MMDRESQDALELINSGALAAPDPGDPAWEQTSGGLLVPGASIGRLHGRYATVSVGAITLNCFEWEVEFSQDMADATAHGDIWDFSVPLKQMWTSRVRGYFTFGGAATATYIYAGSKIGGDPGLVTFTGYSNGGVTAVFTGQGYITRGTFSAPMAMATQEMEIKGYGAPSVGSPA